MARPLIIAIPEDEAWLPGSTWLEAKAERRAFEISHTITHADFGRVVHLPTKADIEEYQRLLDAEEAAHQQFLHGPQPALTPVATEPLPLQQDVNPVA